jgi:PAS domain S-box-containing protein
MSEQRLTSNESSTATILIVDGNPGALYMNSRLLGRQGYRILKAMNGQEGLAVAQAELPDLVLLDVNLPDLTGFEVCERLKTNPTTRHMKVLQTSAARISAPDRIKSLEVGADAYLIEPAEEEELFGTVRALLKLGQHERENRSLIERLTESETRYRSLIEGMPAAMYTIDREGRITFYNEHAAELWGRRPRLGDEEIRFCGSHKLFLPDGTPLPHDKTPMVDAVQDGTPLHGQEVIIERFDGTRRHVVVHIDPLHDVDGTIVGAVNLFTDITERMQAETRLQASQSQLEAMFSQSTVGIAQIDLTGRFLLVNDWLCRIVSRTREELLRLRMQDITHPDDLSRNVKQFTALVQGTGNNFTVEKRYVRPDGSYVWVQNEVWAIQDSDGRVRSATAVVTDITARREQEARLSESEERFALAHEATGIGTFEWHPDTGQVAWNQAHYELFGIDPLRPCSFELWRDAVHPEDLAATLQSVQTVLDRGDGVMDVEYRIVRPDGHIRWMHGLGRMYPTSHHRAQASGGRAAAE